MITAGLNLKHLIYMDTYCKYWQMTPNIWLNYNGCVIFFEYLGHRLLLFNSSNTRLKSFEYMLIISTFAVLIAYLGTGMVSIKLQFDDYKQSEKLNYVKLCIALSASLFSLLAIIGAWVRYQ